MMIKQYFMDSDKFLLGVPYIYWNHSGNTFCVLKSSRLVILELVPESREQDIYKKLFFLSLWKEKSKKTDSRDLKNSLFNIKWKS